MKEGWQESEYHSEGMLVSKPAVVSTIPGPTLASVAAVSYLSTV